MEKPKTVDSAVSAMWGIIGLSTVIVLIGKTIGAIDDAHYVIYLIFIGLMCIFPYKISTGSNGARYFYVGLYLFLFLIGLGVDTRELTGGENFFLIISLPVEIYILYNLFHKNSTEWFQSVRP